MDITQAVTSVTIVGGICYERTLTYRTAAPADRAVPSRAKLTATSAFITSVIVGIA